MNGMKYAALFDPDMTKANLQMVYKHKLLSSSKAEAIKNRLGLSDAPWTEIKHLYLHLFQGTTWLWCLGKCEDALD